MANKVIEVEHGKVTVYPCNYESYLYIKLKKQDVDSPFAVLTRGLSPKKDAGRNGSTGARPKGATVA